jgi:hypothetical protein
VGDGTPISERGPSGGRPKGVPSWGPGHQGWQGGIGHFAPSVWQTGDWWHGKRAAGVAGGGMSPRLVLVPSAVYPFPDIYTPPYSASGYLVLV